jgi:hypothetical protein
MTLPGFGQPWRTFGTYPHEWLKHELDPEFSRERGVIKGESGQLISGTVCGKVAGGTAVAAAGGGNTGDGVLTVDATTPVLHGAKDGTYTVTCTVADTDSGTFRVTDPDGYEIGTVVVGDTFANDIKFAIADGAADFVVGDVFTIAVSLDSGADIYVPIDPAATDGSQNFAGVLLFEQDVTGVSNVPAVFVVQDAVVMKAYLTWPAAVDTQAKKDAIFAQMLRKNFKFAAAA